MGTEYLDIPKCPKCGNKHRYKLKVERSIVMKLLTRSGMIENPRRVKVTRLFTCPLRNEDFEATFILTDTSSDRIKEVSVLGVADENEQD